MFSTLNLQWTQQLMDQCSRFSCSLGCCSNVLYKQNIDAFFSQWEISIVLGHFIHSGTFFTTFETSETASKLERNGMQFWLILDTRYFFFVEFTPFGLITNSFLDEKQKTTFYWNSCPDNHRKYPLNLFNFKLFDEKIAIVPGWAKWLCRSGRNCWSNLDLEGGGAWLSKANKSFWFSCVWFFNISICILKMEKSKKLKKSLKKNVFFCFFFSKNLENFFPKIIFKWKVKKTPKFHLF